MRFGDFVQIQQNNKISLWERLPLGDTEGRPEAWLRDTLYAHPELLPISELDPAYGTLLPVCTELPTEAGPIDNVFVNSQGRLTLVECKLWRNPEARRKVVAQLLDYARVLARWSYADLQRQVSARTRQAGNVLFQIAQAANPHLLEQVFVDQTAQALRQGRFLLLIAGDGIREDVQAIGELINRNAALGFAFGMLEIALYRGPEESLLLQPRVLAKTQLIERTIFALPEGVVLDESDVVEGPLPRTPSERSPIDSAAMKTWWAEVLATRFDDPDQPELRYYHPNNVRTPLPWPGTWVTGYRAASNPPRVGVFISGQQSAVAELLKNLAPFRAALERTLPTGTEVAFDQGPAISRPWSDFSDEAAQKIWVAKTLNHFVNALRPLVRQVMANG